MKNERSKTGGGEENKMHLNDLEERGLAVWGKVTVSGAKDVLESGGLQSIMLDMPSTSTWELHDSCFEFEMKEVDVDSNDSKDNDVNESNAKYDAINISKNTDKSNERLGKKQNIPRIKNTKRLSLSQASDNLFNCYQKSNESLNEILVTFIDKYTVIEDKKIELLNENNAIRKREIELKEKKFALKMAINNKENSTNIFI